MLFTDVFFEASDSCTGISQVNQKHPVICFDTNCDTNCVKHHGGTSDRISIVLLMLLKFWKNLCMGGGLEGSFVVHAWTHG